MRYTFTHCDPTRTGSTTEAAFADLDAATNHAIGILKDQPHLSSVVIHATPARAYGMPDEQVGAWDNEIGTGYWSYLHDRWIIAPPPYTGA